MTPKAACKARLIQPVLVSAAIALIPACSGGKSSSSLYLAAEELPAASGEPITFIDATTDPALGIDFTREPYDFQQKVNDSIAEGFLWASKLRDMPFHAGGVPGTAMLDFDRDGDLDIFITNGPGAANSLYVNQLADTGALSFIDRASDLGIALTEEPAAAVCFGDLNNDGYSDIVITGYRARVFVFENLAGEGFVDHGAREPFASLMISSTSCSLADADGDGLLDIFVGGSYEDWATQHGLHEYATELAEYNRLFVNQGEFRFEDRSEQSGLASYKGVTWALAAVDLDRDGDPDVISADDQASFAPHSLQNGLTNAGGVDRGIIHVHQNDGAGNFRDISYELGTNIASNWMGLAFADLNGDRTIDIFASDFGDFYSLAIGSPPGWMSSRPLMQQGDGSFTNPGVGGTGGTPFGWGSGAVDYDNDGDTDVIFHGALDLNNRIELSNPGSILDNDGEGNFRRNKNALADSHDHTSRIVYGLALGDVNNDGFIDILSTSSAELPADAEPELYEDLGTDYDGEARFLRSTIADGDKLIWQRGPLEKGTAVLELSSASNGRGWLRIKLLGSFGLLSEARANRDAFGSVVHAEGEDTNLTLPLYSGGDFASQHEPVLQVGLGRSECATVTVLWPGGGTNTFGELCGNATVTLPELPCARVLNPADKPACRDAHLDTLIAAGVISASEAEPLRALAEFE